MSLDMNQIYKGYFDTAVSIAFKYVKNEDIAKDIAQDSMIKIWKYQDSFNPKKNKFFPWFYKIVKNTLYDKYRNDKKKIMIRADETGLEYIECHSINVDTIDIISN